MPTFSPVSDKYIISITSKSMLLISSNFLYIEITLPGECWMTFCMKLINIVEYCGINSDESLRKFVSMPCNLLFQKESSA
jgi:hypothetical protein